MHGVDIGSLHVVGQLDGPGEGPVVDLHQMNPHTCVLQFGSAGIRA
jgi:hypothetical protein